ncbi:Spore wall protein 7 [Cucumispora dikerogammari]|nr:Spore wall protein 7 [Cucumispora dikerogammari]
MFLFAFYTLIKLTKTALSNTAVHSGSSSHPCSGNSNIEHVITLVVHNDRNVVNYIDNLSDGLLASETQKHQHILDYYLDIFDELNSYLQPSNVRITLDLRESNEKFYTGSIENMNCEDPETVIIKNNELFKQQEMSSFGNVGFHLTTHSCMFTPEDAVLMDIKFNKTCGRFSSIIFQGMTETKPLIFRTILRALTDTDIDTPESLISNESYRVKLCEYMKRCVAETPIVPGE